MAVILQIVHLNFFSEIYTSMKEEQIRRIIKKKVDELHRLGKKIDPEFDEDTIHDFRITAKTLRAFLRLLRMHFHEPVLKLSGKFKRLYHIAGTIRETHLELKELSEKKLDLPHYSKKLETMCQLQKGEWNKYYSENIFKKLETKLCSLKFTVLHKSVLPEFFETRMVSMRGMIKSIPTEDQVHNVRKQAKDMIYVSGLVKKNWKSASTRIKQLPVRMLTLLGEVIGDYHDGRVSLEHLSAFSCRTMSKEEEITIRNICEEEASILSEEKERITGMIKKFIKTDNNHAIDVTKMELILNQER